ncbi:MAG: FMN-binding protein [Tissierellia bacterium]|nr:FMN-binding protein [Tissierellia bacterium]
MNKTLTLVVKLFLIAAVAALVLGLTNMVTSPVIQERQAQAFKESYSQAYPSGVDFKTIETGVSENIKEVIEVTDGTNQIGYVFSGIGKGGYGGDISYIIGVDNAGVIQGFKPLTHSETPGYGSKMEDQSFIDGVGGVNLSKGVSYGAGNKENGEIQAISGATMTTSALTNSFQEVAKKMADLSDQIEPIGDSVEPYYAVNYEEVFKPLFGADSFKEVNTKGEHKGFVRIVDALKGEEVVGHVVQLKGSGFGGAIDILLGVDKDKVIKEYKVVSHGETPDYGAKIEESLYSGNIVGKSLAKKIKLKADPTRDQDILLISGATVTSMAMQDAMNGGVNALKEYSKGNVEYKDTDLVAIAEEEAKANAPAIDYLAQFEGIDAVEPVEGAALDDKVIAVHKAMNGSEQVGYILDVTSKLGFHRDGIQTGILADMDGVIKQFVYYSMQETEGYGAAAKEEAYVADIVGDSLKSEAFSTGDGTAQGKIDSISGATWTTDAMLEILNSASKAFQALN